MYLKTIEPAQAMGELADLYNAEIASMGRVMAATQCWSARPDMIMPIERLLHQMRDNFSLGLLNFRLITFIAAKYVPSSYLLPCLFQADFERPGPGEGLGDPPGLSNCRAHRAAGGDAGLCRTDYEGCFAHIPDGH